MQEKLMLGTADYAIFGIMLAVSAAIGIFFRFFGGRQRTNEEYLLAGRNMSICPVAFSLMASFMSATTLMGIPTEMYLYGTNMTFMNVGFLLGPIISSYLFLPIYFSTGVSTSYEYLEKRFGKTTRRILSVIFLLQNILFNGVVLYAPALALSAVTNLSLWTSVVSLGIVCTCYCTLGGMKAVIWADVFQSALMYICLLCIIIKGCMDLGGLTNILESAYDGGRILLPTLNMDFSTRYTMWSVILQGLILTTYAYGGNQIQVQRQLTLKNLRRSVIANLISAPMLMAFQLLCCLCGLIFYVNFKSCDPMTSPTKPIQSADQLMPYYITSSMGQYPGLPGLCIAGIFSASLSSISSAVNSMAAVTYEDIIKPIWPKCSGSVITTKTLSIFYGLLSIFVTYLAASLGNLIKSSVLLVGLSSGTALGVFLLAALTTTANSTGANLGVIAAFIFGSCLTYIPKASYYPKLPVENNCTLPITAQNYSMVNSTLYPTLNMSTFYTYTQKIIHSSTKDIPPENFPISYMWISPMTLLVCLIIGYLISWITSCCQKNSEDVPAELLSPIRRRFLKEKQHVEIITKYKFPSDCTITRF